MAPLCPGCFLSLRRLAFEKVPAGSKLKADCARLIEELYCKDAYSLWNGKLAKAVLLSLELDASLSSRRGAGIVQLWEGAMQLEHVLPQVSREGMQVVSTSRCQCCVAS